MLTSCDFALLPLKTRRSVDADPFTWPFRSVVSP